jgi:hypothetical protein
MYLSYIQKSGSKIGSKKVKSYFSSRLAATLNWTIGSFKPSEIREQDGTFSQVLTFAAKTDTDCLIIPIGSARSRRSTLRLYDAKQKERNAFRQIVAFPRCARDKQKSQ